MRRIEISKIALAFAAFISRLTQRALKWSLLALACGGVLFHERLLLLVGGNDRFTGALLAAAYPAPPAKPLFTGEVVHLGIEPGLAATLREPRLGFAIDTSQVVGGHWWSRTAEVEVGRGAQRMQPFDFDRPQLKRLARALGPAWLRVGGTEADDVYYAPQGMAEADLPEGYELVFTQQHWRELARFVRDAEYGLMFTVNAGPGPREDGRWQSTNAEELFRFAQRDPVSSMIWELGNEVNGFWFIHGLSARVSGAQYADDFRRFRFAVQAHFPRARVAGPAGFLWPIMGEPFGSTLGVFDDFLRDSRDAADIVTWHYYPQQSRRCPMATRRARADTLLHPGYLDETGHWADHLQQLVDRHAPEAELWLGESGNAQCGGEPGVSDRFASSLWYLDQLGLLARRGQPMIRQTLVGSDYGLLHPDTLAPRPDYWAALLYRRLTSDRVVEVKRSGDNPYLRAYASCTAAGAGHPAGSITWLLLNLHDHQPARVEFDGQRASWLRVTAPALTSRSAWLNGTPLRLIDGSAPLVRWSASDRQSFWRRATPSVTPPGQRVELLPPHSYAFVLLDARAPACL